MNAGAEYELSEIQGARVGVSSLQICVHGFEQRRRQDLPREDAIVKAWSEAFDLRLDGG